MPSRPVLTWKVALFALVVLAAGCQLIAGTENLDLVSPGDAGPPSFDATTDALAKDDMRTPSGDGSFDASVDAFSGDGGTLDDAELDASQDDVIYFYTDSGLEDSGNAVLLAKTSRPFSIAVDSNNVYWTDQGTNAIYKCAIGGCNLRPTVLAKHQASPAGIAVDSQNVYWTNYYFPFVGECPEFFDGGPPGSVASCAIGGCLAPKTVVSGLDSPSYIAVNPSTGNVYWTQIGCVTGDQSVLTCDAQKGCTGTPATLGRGGIGIGLDGTDVYWAGFGVWECPGGVCSGSVSPKEIVTNVDSWAIAIQNGYVYWADDYSGVSRCSMPGCTATYVGGANDAGFENIAVGLAVDSTNVYWTLPETAINLPSPTGQILTCDPSSCAIPTVLASQQGMPLSLAVDTQSVYWVNSSSGEVFKLAK